MAAQAISSRDINALTGRSDPGLERGMPSPPLAAPLLARYERHGAATP